MNTTHDASVDTNLGDALDKAWMMAMAINVFWMQLGFAMLEVGASAAGSATAIAMKNMGDMAVSSVVFGLIGWGITGFGADSLASQSATGAGSSGFALFETVKLARFVFTYGFAAAAVTIVSGAVTGRLRFLHYLVFAAVMAGIVFPFVAHASWAESGWLRRLGFIDFAGSGVVHLTGGCFGLAASIKLGPRDGVFRESGEYNPRRSSPTQALFGSLVLWVAWFGFNAGSSLGLTGNGLVLAEQAASSTLLAGGAGSLVAFAWGYLRSHGQHIDVFDAITGLLAALVGVTGVCGVTHSWEAAIVGALSALAALASGPVLERFRIDDAVAVIPVHLVAGMTGVVLTGLFAHPGPVGDETGETTRLAGLFHGGGMHLLGIQVLGCLVIAVWSLLWFFITAFLTEHVICCGPLRIRRAPKPTPEVREAKVVPDQGTQRTGTGAVAPLQPDAKDGRSQDGAA